MKAWLDRTWNRIFHRDKLLTFTTNIDAYKYNDIVIMYDGNSYHNYRCLGKKYYKHIKSYENKTK